MSSKESMQIADLERRIRNLEKDAVDDNFWDRVYCDCSSGYGCKKCGYHRQYSGNVPNKHYKPRSLKPIWLGPTVPDRIEFDGTEYAHPAWNRGHDAGKNAAFDHADRNMRGVLTQLEDIKRFAMAGPTGRQNLLAALESLDSYIHGCLEVMSNEHKHNDE